LHGKAGHARKMPRTRRQEEGYVRDGTGRVKKSSRIRFRPRWLDDYDTSNST
jgi:hypothetical protein